MDYAPGNVIWVSTGGRAGALGTAADPFRSIQSAIDQAPPGSTIMIKAGTYTENVSIKVGGSASAPLQLVSADGPGAAEIRPASQTKDTIEISRADHVVLDGLKVIGPESVSGNAIHIHAHITATAFDPATNIVVKNAVIVAGDGDGIKLSKVEYITLANNTITGSTGTEEGIDAVGVHHLVISHNTVTDSGGVAINVKGGSYDVLIQNNHVDGAASHGIGVGGYTEEAYFWPGFIGSETYEVKDIRVIGNEVENTVKQGIRVIGGQEVEIADNWIHAVAHQYAVGVSPAGVTHSPAWPSDDVTMTGNHFDKTKWLRVDTPTTHTSVMDNTVSNLPPADWHETGAHLASGTGHDDIYQVGSASSQVFDQNGGHDTVLTSTTYALAAGQEIEALATTSLTSTGAIKLTGNEFGQTITGNAGANVINGREGNDILTGGAGADTFVFDTGLKPGANVDRIVDFSVVDDTIRLENGVFTAVGKAGALAGGAFWTGAAAHDSSDRIIYNSETGQLLYDADGTGAGQAIQFAQLASKLQLTAADLAII